MAFLKGEAEVGVRKIEKQEAPAPADRPTRYTVIVNGKSYDLAIDGDTATVDGKAYNVSLGEAAAAGAGSLSTKDGGGTPVSAQMPGKVIRLLVQVGDHIEAGTGILVLEAMKMEHRLKSPRDGIISKITSIAVGGQVKEGEIMFELEDE